MKYCAHPGMVEEGRRRGLHRCRSGVPSVPFRLDTVPRRRRASVVTRAVARQVRVAVAAALVLDMLLLRLRHQLKLLASPILQQQERRKQQNTHDHLHSVNSKLVS